MSNLKDFKCPNCGGSLQFDSSTQKLKCPHCDGVFDPESFNEDKDFVVENDTWENEDGLLVYTCKSCGGSILTDKQTAATSCPYCGNPVVMISNVRGDYKPSRILPFKLDKKAAKEKYKEHLSHKILLPKEFSSDAIIDEIKGIYIPFWLFGGKANTKIWFDATKVRTYSDSNYNYTETSHYKLYRSGSVSFNDIPVDASSKVQDELSQSIEPYDTNDLKEYKDNYLAGYLADKYDVGVNESKEIANKRIHNSTVELFAQTTAGYSTCVLSNIKMGIDDGKQEYVFLPMWLLNVKYNENIYTFAMNGQTGKFVGDLPLDKKKLVLILLLTFLVTFGLTCLIQYLI